MPRLLRPVCWTLLLAVAVLGCSREDGVVLPTDTVAPPAKQAAQSLQKPRTMHQPAPAP